MDEVREADLFRAVVPTSLGGHGLGLDALAQGTRVMAHGCPASAWTISFLMLHGWLLAKFPAAGRDVLFADGPVVLAPAPLAPTGTVTVDGDGYRLSGRWEWATGIAHADWVIVHAVQTEPEFTTMFLAVPRVEVEVDDVWFTSGMRATGSNTVRIEDRFVPAELTVPARSMLDGTDPLAGDGMARHPVPSVLALVAAAPRGRGRGGGRAVHRTAPQAGARLHPGRSPGRPAGVAGAPGHCDERSGGSATPVGRSHR